MSSLNATLERTEVQIPDKKYFAIGEVSQICHLKSHVLRYWESVFPQLKPTKRSGRRYYQRRDLELILKIKSLLQEQGYTIQGAKTKLSHPLDTSQEQSLPTTEDKSLNGLKVLMEIREELQSFKKYIEKRY